MMYRKILRTTHFPDSSLLDYHCETHIFISSHLNNGIAMSPKISLFTVLFLIASREFHLFWFSALPLNLSPRSFPRLFGRTCCRPERTSGCRGKNLPTERMRLVNLVSLLILSSKILFLLSISIMAGIYLCVEHCTRNSYPMRNVEASTHLSLLDRPPRIHLKKPPFAFGLSVVLHIIPLHQSYCYLFLYILPPYWYGRSPDFSL